jgi:hypothetical protein
VAVPVAVIAGLLFVSGFLVGFGGTFGLWRFSGFLIGRST